MKKIVCVLLSFSFLAGCIGIPPRGITAEMRADYVTAVASIGCVMRDESDYLPVEFQAGLTREQSVQLTEYHLAKGTAVKLPGDAGVKLTTGGCA